MRAYEIYYQPEWSEFKALNLKHLKQKYAWVSYANCTVTKRCLWYYMLWYYHTQTYSNEKYLLKTQIGAIR